jgi:hypothetical protein
MTTTDECLIDMKLKSNALTARIGALETKLAASTCDYTDITNRFDPTFSIPVSEIGGATHLEIVGTWTRLEWELQTLKKECQAIAEQIEVENFQLAKMLSANTNTGQ